MPAPPNACSLCSSAWVPITAEALFSLHRRGGDPLRRVPVSSCTGMPRGFSQREKLRKCCSARICVGAIRMAGHPDSIATSMAAAATTVFPDPTSPCRRRCIRCACAISDRMAAIARDCAPVRSKGRDPRNLSSSSLPDFLGFPRGRRASFLLVVTRVCTPRSSLRASSLRAGSSSSGSDGK